MTSFRTAAACHEAIAREATASLVDTFGARVEAVHGRVVDHNGYVFPRPSFRFEPVDHHARPLTPTAWPICPLCDQSCATHECDADAIFGAMTARDTIEGEGR